MNLDYNLKTDEERVALCRDICEKNKKHKLSNKDLEQLADYLLRVREGGTTVRERKQRYPITTNNRSLAHATKNVSLDSLGEAAEFFYDGEIVATGAISPATDPITEEDIKVVPGLAQNRVAEAALREAVNNSSGHQRRQLKAQLIEVWREAYFLRSLYRGVDPSKIASRTVRDVARLQLNGEVLFDEDGYPYDTSAVSLMDPVHISYLIQWYLPLLKETYYDLECDMRWLMTDFAALVRRTFPPHTPLHDLTALRALGYQLRDIPEIMFKLHGISKNSNQWNYVLTHTVSNAIAKRAQREYIIWYYSNVEYGEWKKCNRCGKWKPLHPIFWTRDGDKFYSICKKCRKTRKDEPGDVHLTRRGGDSNGKASTNNMSDMRTNLS